MRFLKRHSLILLGFWIFICCNEDKKTLNIQESITDLIKTSTVKSISPEEHELNLLTALKLVNTLDDSLLKVDKLQDIASSYYYLKNYAQLNKINEQALKISKSLLDSVGIAKSYNYKAIWYRNQRIDSAYKYFYKANKIYSLLDQNKNNEKTEYAFDYGRTLLDLAKLSRKVNDYSKSEALTIKAIQKFKLSGNLQYLPIAYTNLGIISKHLGNYNEGVHYYQKAIKYTENTERDTMYKIISLNNIGTIYKSQKQYSKAEINYKKGLNYKNYLKTDIKRYAFLLDNLGYVKFLANQDNDSTLHLFNEALKMRDSINHTTGLSTSFLHFAEYYQWKKNSQLAMDYAKKAKSLSIASKSNSDLLQAYNLLAQVSPPEEGRQYAMEYIKLNDSLNKRDNLFRDKFARIRFETEEKEKQILQKEQLIKEGEQQIQEVQNQNTIYLLGMLLLITFIAFIIYFSRQRTRYLAQQNKIVEFQAAYETETRISKRLHDELGNDIFQVMMQYQNDPHDPQISKKLNTAYHKARDISRENSEFEVDETYLEELTDMLTNYTENHCKLILRGIDKIHWDTVDKNLKITIYRVLQELMTNMQKHSRADLVAIVFKNDKNKILIKYSDNGVGIEQEDIRSKNGLRNTEKRIQAVSGTIAFDSANNKGFKAEIKIPL